MKIAMLSKLSLGSWFRAGDDISYTENCLKKLVRNNKHNRDKK